MSWCAGNPLLGDLPLLSAVDPMIRLHRISRHSLSQAVVKRLLRGRISEPQFPLARLLRRHINRALRSHPTSGESGSESSQNNNNSRSSSYDTKIRSSSQNGGCDLKSWAHSRRPAQSSDPGSSRRSVAASQTSGRSSSGISDRQ